MAGKFDLLKTLFATMKSVGNVSWEETAVNALIKKLNGGEKYEPSKLLQALASSINPSNIGTTTKQVIGNYWRKELEKNIANDNKERLSKILTQAEIQKIVGGDSETLDKVLNAKYEKLYEKVLATNRALADEMLYDSDGMMTLGDVQAMTPESFERLSVDNKAEVLGSLQDKWKEDFSTKKKRREYVKEYTRYVESDTEGNTYWEALEDDEQEEILDYLVEKYKISGKRNQQDQRNKWKEMDTRKDIYNSDNVVNEYIEKKKEKRLAERIRKNRISALTKKNWKSTTKMVSGKLIQGTNTEKKSKKAKSKARNSAKKANRSYSKSETYAKQVGIRAGIKKKTKSKK